MYLNLELHSKIKLKTTYNIKRFVATIAVHLHLVYYDELLFRRLK